MDSEKEQKTTSDSVFKRIFSFLLSDSDPEKEKKRLLKEIAKQCRKFKPQMYNPKGDLASPAMAKFFFLIYKTLGPAQVILSHAETSGVLKTILIENALSEEQLSLKEKLSEESIRERAGQTDSKTLVQELKNYIKKYHSFFEISRINEINSMYKHLSVLLRLINFDYYFLLKKFDSRLPEKAFSYNPRFEAINAQYINDELKDFLEILPVVETAADWNSIWDVIKQYRDVEAVSRDSWKKILQMIKQAQKTKELNLIVQLIDRDPFLKIAPGIKNENIVESYLSKLRMNTEMTMQKIVKERNKKNVDDLAQKVFGTASVSRLTNYSEKTNILFAKKMLGGYTYVTALNYVKAFLLDYVKKDVREVVDLLLIPAKWIESGPSQNLSESFHQLLALSDEITAFDASLAEDVDIGKKIHGSLFKADRDKNASANLKAFLKTINEQAKEMILKAGQNCINVGNVLRQAIEDCNKKHPELILNWKELHPRNGGDMKVLLTAVYKQVYYFIKLLKTTV